MAFSKPLVNTDERISLHQHIYIEKCKEKFLAESSKSSNKTTNLLYFDPDNYVPSGLSSLENYYQKPVIIMAPHLQFGPIGKCLKCNMDIKPDGWSPTTRRVENLTCCSYLIQYKYKCKCGTFTADSLLNDDDAKVPDYLKLFYPITSTKQMWFIMI